MHRLLTSDLWREVSRLSRKSKTHHAAIAYVTAETVKFCDGDILVVDATRGAITSGVTDPKVLLKAYHEGALIYSCANLHAKLLVMDGQAIIGSANLSENSQNLHECAVITDDPTLVGQARAYIQQLRERSELLTQGDLDALTRLPVVRKGGRGRGVDLTQTLGTRRWIVGVTPIKPGGMSSDDERTNKCALSKLGTKLEKDRDDLEWLRLRGNSKMRKEAQVGDRLIVAEGSHAKTNHLSIHPACTILSRANSEDSTFLYYDLAEAGKTPTLGKTDFTKLLHQTGSPLIPTARMVRELPSVVFEDLVRHWPKR